MPPRACSVDRAGRRRRSATASAASRCSTLLLGGQPPGSVRDVREAAVSLYCLPRCRGEWRAARAAPRVARMAPESALDEPAGAARAPCKLAHRLHAAVNSLVDGGQSHDCRSKPAGFVTPFTQSFFGLAFSFAWFYFVFSFAKRQRGGGGRALTTGNYMSKVRGRLLAAWVVWGARLRRGPGAPLSRRGVGPTLTYRGEARTTAQFINSTHLLVPSPVQRRSGRLPPRPPGRVPTGPKKRKEKMGRRRPAGETPRLCNTPERGCHRRSCA